MALPIVLIHGYSSEGYTSDGGSYEYDDISKLYGRLVDDLLKLGLDIVRVDVSRYISLDDGLTIDDISLAMDRVLRAEHPQLLQGGFDVIIHSTGALVTRNWIRRYTKPGECPIRHLIHLAGANFGSGWAHVGTAQAARFIRFLNGVQRGLGVLSALEFASSWTIDLHRHFLQRGCDMFHDYKVMEFCIVGSQVPPEYIPIPVRYGKEDGSDGVVRVSSSNLNFNYLRIVPTDTARALDWQTAARYVRMAGRVSIASRSQGKAFDQDFYRIDFDSMPGQTKTYFDGDRQYRRSVVPFAIPYGANHSDMAKTNAIVYGDENRDEVLPLVRAALSADEAGYLKLPAEFAKTTQDTIARVLTEDYPKGFWAGMKRAMKDAMNNPRAQYDGHAQLVFRMFDQNGKPVDNYSIFFNSFGGDGSPDKLINELFEDRHINTRTHNCVNYYLRLLHWNQAKQQRESLLAMVRGVSLEIDALDPLTQRICYMPVRIQIRAEEIIKWLVPNQTTVIDVHLLRLPSDVAFILRGKKA